MLVLGKRVLVQKNNSPEVTESGIFIPTTPNTRLAKGVVVSIGSGVTEAQLSVGQTVLFNEFASTPVNNGDEVVLFENDIIGIL